MKHRFLSFILLITVIASCNSHSGKQSPSAQDSPSAASSNQANMQPAASAATQHKSIKHFDITKISVSDKPLGAFPYFNLPENYEANSSNKPQDFGGFPFREGDHFEWVNGIGDVYNDPASVYIIRRNDKNIRIRFCISSFSGGWVIAETKS